VAVNPVLPNLSRDFGVKDPSPFYPHFSCAQKTVHHLGRSDIPLLGDDAANR